MPVLRPDVPMSLGDHLHELRSRIILPIYAFIIVFVLAFFMQDQLKILFIQPLLWACAIANDLTPGCVEKAGIHLSQIDYEKNFRVLKVFDLSESVWVSVSLSMWAAVVVTIPLIVFQIWQFICVGLTAQERRLGFLLVPAGIILFYLGAVTGYYVGMPWFFAWFIEWTARDPIGVFDLRMEYYKNAFFIYTVCFGLLMDIPWLVVVICRIGFTTPDKLAGWRRHVVLIVAIISGIITPPDPFSMLIMMVPMYLLFEGGLLAARLVGGPRKDPDRA